MLLLYFVLYRLISQMEIYSTSLGNGSVVKSNVAVQSVALSPESDGQTINVRFSVKKGELFVSCTYSSRHHSAINCE